MGKKYFTLSFDDGLEQDKRVIRLMRQYGLKGTFNLNAGLFGTRGEVKGLGTFSFQDCPEGVKHKWPFSYVQHHRIPLDEVCQVYEGMEIATHGFRHEPLGAVSEDEMRASVDADKAALEKIFGTTVVGHAYAQGSTSPAVQAYLKAQGYQYAIEHLPLQTDQPGRFTQGVARLLKAKSAAWQGNWSECAAQVNAIEQSGVYSLLPDLNSIFNAADLNHQEAMLVSQWSKGTGGWFVNATTGTNSGHRMCVHCTPKYNDEQGMMMSFEYGGYPWGRMFPNQHLLDLYDKQHDRRYEAFYRTTFQYNNSASLPRGRQLGDTLIPTNQAQYLNVHPMITKYNDSYTKASVSDNQSFKDIIIYRLPEAYILGCEAYIHLNKPDSARYYYNKTWTRAGNAEETGTITIAMLADEQARELAMEGDRWNFLKREGLLIDYVRQFGGEQVKNDKGVVLNDDVRIRSNIKAVIWAGRKRPAVLL